MTNTTSRSTLSSEDLLDLKQAKLKMERIGWAMQGLNKVGTLIENRIDLLPQKQQQWLQQVTHKVLHTVVKSNLITMKPHKSNLVPWNGAYKAFVTSSGAVGGALGATAFAVDLTVATKFMMRSIMDIARSEGENLTEFDTQLACLQVFALGGKSKHDDGLETGYYATRVALNTAVKGASAKLVEGFLKGSSNPLLRFISVIASRFSVQVSEKFVAQAIPLIGAAGGAAINLAFINHFQNMAQAHFTVRRLERKYGESLVRENYERTGLK
ncbi:EcsC family protein [uncultured Kriegella sp.]|uniref:EcsC family protein n=1 Tax=uncultured Kriegella sp. TaxID=1798910 RepID=UPI0030DD7D14|tara:strand:- start:25393 stop:26202 length:810 start_codon:yes stop_codon:yes gene_type:complete